MTAIILMEADDAEASYIHQRKNDDGYWVNKTFPSVEAADLWLQENARSGW